MSDAPPDVLDLFRIDAALSHGDLWLRYFDLGGMSTGLQLEAYLYGALRPSRHDHDIIAHALNERFVELGGNHLHSRSTVIVDHRTYTIKPTGLLAWLTRIVSFHAPANM